MALDSSEYVSIAELVFYTPGVLLAYLICSRHGFSRASGWVYTFLLCIVRVAGAICQLVMYSSPSSGLVMATIILDGIGISPLLLGTLGMLSRL